MLHIICMQPWFKRGSNTPPTKFDGRTPECPITKKAPPNVPFFGPVGHLAVFADHGQVGWVCLKRGIQIKLSLKPVGQFSPKLNPNHKFTQYESQTFYHLYFFRKQIDIHALKYSMTNQLYAFKIFMLFNIPS